MLVPTVLELFFALRVLDLERRLETLARQEAISKEIIYHADELYVAAVSASLNLVALKIPGLRVPVHPDTRRIHSDRMRFEIQKISELVAAGSQQARQLSIIARVINELLTIFEKDFATADNGASNFRLMLGSLPTFSKIQQRTLVLESAVRKFKAPEVEVSRRVQRAIDKTRGELVATAAAAIALTLIMACSLAIFFSRSITLRIAILVENAKRLAAQKDLLPELKGDDELILLDRSYHTAALEIKELEKLKNELYSMIAHDLRSPLTAVSVVLELLAAGKHGELNDSAKTGVDLARRNVRRILDLINDLLDLAKLQVGKMPLEIEETSPQAILQDVLPTVEPLANAKGIHVVVQAETEVNLKCDRARVAQVLVNLASNAVKFAPTDSTVKIECHLDGRNIKFSVYDQGRGIPEDSLEQIFGQFSQVSITDARRGSGTGLGLSISKMIVEAHEGTIGVESTEVQGSTFFFSLPISGPDRKAGMVRKPESTGD